jgi:hypothetical protein
MRAMVTSLPSLLEAGKSDALTFLNGIMKTTAAHGWHRTCGAFLKVIAPQIDGVARGKCERYRSEPAAIGAAF